MSGVWQAGWVAFMVGLWTAVTYLKANIFSHRPFVKLPVLNIIWTACLCLFAATDRTHGVPPPITYEVAVLEPVILGIVLAGLVTVRRLMSYSGARHRRAKSFPRSPDRAGRRHRWC
jgi:hypothetical protein